jgi:hypothetical protein
MPPISDAKDAVTALSRIMEGVGSGELTASEARLKAIEVLDLDQRLAALEEHHARS